MRQGEAVAGTPPPYIIVRTNEMQTQTNSNGTLNPAQGECVRANAQGEAVRMRQDECPGRMRQGEAVAATPKPYIIVRTNEMQTQTNSNGTPNPG